MSARFLHKKKNYNSRGRKQFLKTIETRKKCRKEKQFFNQSYKKKEGLFNSAKTKKTNMSESLPLPPPPSFIDTISCDLGLDISIYRVLAQHLRDAPNGINIAVLADDSGSMLGERWAELQTTLQTMCHILSHFDEDGFDLFFLNRPGVANVRHIHEIQPCFFRDPSGGTDLIRSLEKIYQGPLSPQQSGKRLLVIVLTDGLPDGNKSSSGNAGDLKGVMKFIKKQHDKYPDHLFCTFAMCTEDDKIVAEYNKWDDKIGHFDITDDYVSERNEVLSKRGPDFKFTRQDWVAKLIIGSMDPYYDFVDESTSFFEDKSTKSVRSCCIVS